MERMYKETVRVKLALKTGITEDFLNVKNFKISGYVEFLDGIFANTSI